MAICNLKYPQVAIIVLNWNGFQDTYECINSLLKLNYRNFDIILVDNDSNDDSFARLKENFKSRIIFLKSKKNLGYAGGNNLGIAFALKNKKYKYIWILNNDTVVDEKCLDYLVQRMEKEEKAAMCGATILFYDNNQVQAFGGGKFNKWFATGKLLNENTYKQRPPAELIEKKLDYILGASIFFSANFLRSEGGFCEDYFLYFEEIDIAMRAKKKDYKLLYAPESIVYHKEGRSIGSNSRNPIKRSYLADFYGIKNKIIFSKKYYPYALPTVYIAILIAFINRIRRRQWNRAKMILRIIFASLKPKYFCQLNPEHIRS